MLPRLVKTQMVPLLLVLAILGCTDRRSEPPRKEAPPVRDVSGFLPGHGPDAPAWSPGAPEMHGEGLSRPMPKGPADILSARGTISGTVSVADSDRAPSGATLFVFVSRAGQPGPPVAVARIRDPKFPQPFRIGASDVIAGTLEGDLDVGARLDVDGNVSTREPENLSGVYTRNPVRVGQAGVSIAIARAPREAAASPAGGTERGASLSGTIRLAPGVKLPAGGVLFVIARQGSQIAGPPFAVKRIDATGFPIPYNLSIGDTMSPDILFSGPVSVTARLDADGNASTKGQDDLFGQFARNPATVGDAGVDITLGAAPAAGP